MSELEHTDLNLFFQIGDPIVPFPEDYDANVQYSIFHSAYGAVEMGLKKVPGMMIHFDHFGTEVETPDDESSSCARVELLAYDDMYEIEEDRPAFGMTFRSNKLIPFELASNLKDFVLQCLRDAAGGTSVDFFEAVTYNSWKHTERIKGPVFPKV